MEDKLAREEFDTGLGKIRHEIKSRLVPHGFFGTVTHTDICLVDQVPTGSKIEIVVNVKTLGRSFSREEIERLPSSGRRRCSLGDCLDD